MLSKCIALTSKICVHFPEVTQSKCWVSCENSTGLFILVAQRQSKVETWMRCLSFSNGKLEVSGLSHYTFLIFHEIYNFHVQKIQRNMLSKKKKTLQYNNDDLT